jgi:hypothetical protein
MAALTTDQARALLGGGLNGHDVRDGRDLLEGHANRDGMTLITRPWRAWSWYQQDQGPEREKPAARPGSRLIAAAAVLLVGLGIGLLAVSYAAQYRYVLSERHQSVASLIEAGALDVGLIIFSLLALGLARAGLAARVERGLIVACAAGSALMNFAPAASDSWRSVLAYTMPPVFLAVVVDRVVVVVRRHVLGMRDGRSPWWAAVAGSGRAARFGALAALYALRLALAPASTCAGTRRAILAAAPLPAAAGKPEATGPPRRREQDRPRRRPAARGGSMTARFLALVAERHGEFASIDPARVSPICAELAPEVGIDPGNARTALRKAVLAAHAAALPAGEGDAR